MKRLLLSLFMLVLTVHIFAQNNKKYQANWDDLNTRPVAEWFKDAKFGIFIHWGPYSVPAWSPAGTYTEWYQEWLQTHQIYGNRKPDADAIPNFQDKVYGDESSYYDFGRMFKAELYDPKKWAELFKKSGAKYVVLTSKHHDGFTLWPNKEAQNGRNFKWNAAEVGAKRDLIAPYMEAMREAGLKAGLYYSLYEWYHPWYRPLGNDPKFVDEHYHPQFKDLVTKYSPDLIYVDGEWDKTDEYWRSAELLQWLFNESPCKDEVVINDRWFKGCRHKYGGFATTEYETEGVKGRKWEEVRGIGTSFGYNRDEDLTDYSSARQLVLMLCDIVSMGGNLCLNVGPRADGKIPVIQQERLLEIGAWLDINGEAIYSSDTYKKACQWSDGNREYVHKKEGDVYVTADYIERQTIYKEDGMAIKELFFTQRDGNLYAISPLYKEKIVIKDFKIKKSNKVSLLGTDKPCTWRQVGRNLEITLPVIIPTDNLPNYAYTIKIEGVKL